MSKKENIELQNKPYNDMVKEVDKGRWKIGLCLALGCNIIGRMTYLKTKGAKR